MKTISILEDAKAVLTTQKEALENKRGDIYVREQQALGEALVGFYGVFPEEVEVEVTRGSVYFKMTHPDYSYKKELFNLYLRENWNFDGEENKKSYTGIDLSYYTTSTKGVDAWELKRLQMLGKIAEVVHDKHDEIIDAVNNAVIPFKAEFAEVFKEMQEIGSEIRVVETQIATLIKEQILSDLMNGGVTFDKGASIQLKHNYCPFITDIKLTNISKSGKTATAVFTFFRGSTTSSEENVRINDVVNQVLGFSKSIVK
jgi:hypothetical protein